MISDYVESYLECALECIAHLKKNESTTMFYLTSNQYAECKIDHNYICDCSFILDTVLTIYISFLIPIWLYCSFTIVGGQL